MLCFHLAYLVFTLLCPLSYCLSPPVVFYTSFSDSVLSSVPLPLQKKSHVVIDNIQILWDINSENELLQKRVMQKNSLTMNNEINNCVNSENSTQLQQRSLSQGNLLTDDLVNDCDINLDMTSNLSIDEEMEYFLEHT